MKYFLVVLMLTCVVTAVSGKEYRFPQYGLFFSLPGPEQWEPLIETEGEDFLTLNFQSSSTQKLAMFIAFPDQGRSMEENAKQFMEGFVRVSSPTISEPKPAYLDGNSALRYEIEYRDQVTVRRALLIVSTKEGMAYGVFLSPRRGEPMADETLRAIGASIRIGGSNG